MPTNATLNRIYPYCSRRRCSKIFLARAFLTSRIVCVTFDHCFMKNEAITFLPSHASNHRLPLNLNTVTHEFKIYALTSIAFTSTACTLRPSCPSTQAGTVE